MAEPNDTSTGTSSFAATSTNPIPMPDMQHHDQTEQGSAPTFPIPETERRQYEGQRPGAPGQAEAFGSEERGSVSMPQPFSTMSNSPPSQLDLRQPQYGSPSGPPPTSLHSRMQPPPPQPSPDPRAFSPSPNLSLDRTSQSQDGFRPPSHPPPSHAQDSSRAFSPPPSYQAHQPGTGPYGPGKPNGGYPPGPNNMQPGPQGQMMANTNNGYYNRGGAGAGWPYPGPNQNQSQQGGYGGYGPPPTHFAPQGHGYGNAYGGGYDGQQGYGLGRPSHDSSRPEEDERYRERLTGPNTVDVCGCGLGACMAVLCCCCLLD